MGLQITAVPGFSDHSQPPSPPCTLCPVPTLHQPVPAPLNRRLQMAAAPGFSDPREEAGRAGAGGRVWASPLEPQVGRPLLVSLSVVAASLLVALTSPGSALSLLLLPHRPDRFLALVAKPRPHPMAPYLPLLVH
jgi:hypothetical protein